MSTPGISKKEPGPAPGYPSPELLHFYSKIDPALPALMVKAAALDQLYEFVYAMFGLILAGGTIVGLVWGFIYLSLHNLPSAANTLLSLALLSIIGLLIRNRLKKPAEPTERRSAGFDSNADPEFIFERDDEER